MPYVELLAIALDANLELPRSSRRTAIMRHVAIDTGFARRNEPKILPTIVELIPVSMVYYKSIATDAAHHPAVQHDAVHGPADAECGVTIGPHA